MSIFKKSALALLISSSFMNAHAASNPAANENLDLQLNNGTTATSCTFTDVPASEWYAKYVSALCSTGIVIGYADGNNRVFKPSQYANMAEFMKMVNYTNDYIGTSMNSQCNSTKGAANWWDCHVSIAKARGLIPYPSIVSGAAYVPRGYAFSYIAKAFFGQTLSATDAAKLLVAKGIVASAKDYRLNDNLFRAELAKLTVHAAGAAGRLIAYGLIPATIYFGIDMPKSSITPQQTGNTLAEKVVKRVKQEVGKKAAPWIDDKYTYCARLVRMMFDKPAKSAYSSAANVCSSFQSRGLVKTGTPPLGSVICYQPNGYGHISIATGSGTEIGVTTLADGVTERPVGSIIRNGYIGYITADNFNNNY